MTGYNDQPKQWSEMVKLIASYSLSDYLDEKLNDVEGFDGFDQQDADEDIFSMPDLDDCLAAFLKRSFYFYEETDFSMGDMAFVFCRNPNVDDIPPLPTGAFNINWVKFNAVTPQYETFAWMSLWHHFNERFEGYIFFNWVNALIRAGVSFDQAAPFAAAGIHNAADVINYVENDIDIHLVEASNA